MRRLRTEVAQFHNSAAYRAARDKRLPGAEFRMTLLEGPPTA